MPATERPGEKSERSGDVNVRGVLLFGFWLVAGAAVLYVAVGGFLRLLDRERRAGDKPLSPIVAASLKRTPPEPRLEARPLALKTRTRAEEDAALSTYGWVDQKAGLVRLPIDRAMQLMVERGLPPSKPMAAVAPAPEQKR